MNHTSPKSSRLPVLISYAVSVLPHFIYFPGWVITWCLFCCFYLILSLRFPIPFPNKYLRFIMIATGFLGIVSTSHLFYERNASVGLLAIMLGSKLLESSTERDKMVIILLSYFMLISNLFFTQALFMMVYQFGAMLCITLSLVHMNNPGGGPWPKLKYGSALMVKALPIMIILFIIFPRVHGGLWGHFFKRTGQTGFSDHLNMKELINLVQNRAIAFRVDFLNRTPQAHQLYWRGLVFENLEGDLWNTASYIPRRFRRYTDENRVKYLITMEPHNRKWLYLLDLPTRMQRGGYILSDHTARLRRSLKRRRIIKAESSLGLNPGQAEPPDLTAYHLPEEGNKRAKALARSWRAASASPGQIIRTATDFFLNGGFKYSMNPPELAENKIDDFLFRTRKGYCGHFASAFAYLMRAADIPSRLVAGYLGGEFNPMGDYLIVRQSDAHVWVEVWQAEKGWERIDPTAIIAPERLDSGMEAALPPEERPFSFSSPFNPMFHYLKNIRFGWDSLNVFWYNRILAYSYIDQAGYFSILKIRPGSWLFALISAAIIFGLGVIVFLLYHSKIRFIKPGRIDPVKKCYESFRIKIEKSAGLPYRQAEGPMDYANRIAAARPDLYPAVWDITRKYIELRYAGKKSKDAIKGFKSLVKRFKAGGKHRA